MDPFSCRIDDYAKDGGPGVVRLLCSFCHEPLRSLTLFGLAFCQPKKTGEPFPPPPNLAISSQMTMKLGKDILWGEIFTN